MGLLKYLVFSLSLLAPLTFVRAHDEPLKDVFNYKEHLTDTKHLREDLKGMINKDQVISQKDSIFYYFTLHDKDHNNLLDGLEIAHSFNHIYTHHPENHFNQQIDFEHAVEVQVDNILKYDVNNDGYISFDEYVASLKDININLVNAAIPPRNIVPP